MDTHTRTEESACPQFLTVTSNASRRSGRVRQRGALLLETMAAIFVLGLVGTALLTALSTVMGSTDTIVGEADLDNLARNQMEYMYSLPYQPPPSAYPTLAVPAGYVITCQASVLEVGNSAIENVLVTITVNGVVEFELAAIRAQE